MNLQEQQRIILTALVGFDNRERNSNLDLIAWGRNTISTGMA
jgi:hypothetical protein